MSALPVQESSYQRSYSERRAYLEVKQKARRYSLEREHNTQFFHPFPTLKTVEYLSNVELSSSNVNLSNVIALMEVLGVWMGKSYAENKRFLCDPSDSQLQETMPWLSLATLQRALNVLEATGLIVRHTFRVYGSGQVRSKRYIEGIPIEHVLARIPEKTTLEPSNDTESSQESNNIYSTSNEEITKDSPSGDSVVLKQNLPPKKLWMEPLEPLEGTSFSERRLPNQYVKQLQREFIHRVLDCYRIDYFDYQTAVWIVQCLGMDRKALHVIHQNQEKFYANPQGFYHALSQLESFLKDPKLERPGGALLSFFKKLYGIKTNQDKKNEKSLCPPPEVDQSLRQREIVEEEKKIETRQGLTMANERKHRQKELTQEMVKSFNINYELATIKHETLLAKRNASQQKMATAKTDSNGVYQSVLDKIAKGKANSLKQQSSTPPESKNERAPGQWDGTSDSDDLKTE